MAATIGVTKTGPMTGICCNHAKGGVWITATTGGAAVVTAAATFTEATLASRLVLSGTVDPTGVAGTSVSLRAAATTVHVAGESTGAAGVPPVRGFARATTATATEVTASCVTEVTAGAGTAGGDASETVAFGDAPTAVVEIVVVSGVVARCADAVSAGVAEVFDDVVSLDSCAPVAAFVVVAAEAATFERDSRCALPVIVMVPAGLAVATCVGDDADVEAVGVPEVSPPAGLLGCPVDEFEVGFVDSAPDGDDDGDEDEPGCPVVSAEATPHPNPIAAPIPKAAAKPPIRPTYADAPMRRLDSDRDYCQ